MKKYPVYKESGVQWMANVPAEWHPFRLKHLLSCSVAGLWGTEPLEDGADIICYRAADFDFAKGVLRTDKITYRSIQLDDKNPRLIKEGDILLEKSGGGEKTPVGRVVRANAIGRSTCSNFVHKLTPDTQKVNPSFLYYLLRSFYSEGQTNLLYTQTTGIQNLNMFGYLNSVFFIPSLLEQKSIAYWLDAKCDRIDSILSQVDAKIAQLQRLRKAIIANVVFRGINFQGTLRESGLRWMPQIPSHWETIRLKRLGRFCKGLTFTKSDLEEEGHRVISYGQVHAKSNSGVSLSEDLIRYVPDSIVAKGTKAKVNKGSFIFADTSEDLEGCGNCVYNNSSEILYAGYHTIILQMNEFADNRYLAYLFLTDEWRSQIRNSVNGVKVYSITQAIMNQCDVVLPPKSEQTEIADYLDDKCLKIDNMIAKYEKQKELLARYRKAIITQAVTGQICVCSDDVLKMKDYSDSSRTICLAAEP